MIREMKRSHPWLNERAKEAIMRKNNAEGTPSYSEKREECVRILAEERKKYVQKMKEKLQDLPKKSKKWWQINRELLNRKCKTSSIPNLKSGSNWITEAKDKANAFAQFFVDKAELPQETIDCPFLEFLTKSSKDEFAFVHVLVNVSLINYMKRRHQDMTKFQRLFSKS